MQQMPGGDSYLDGLLGQGFAWLIVAAPEF